MKRLFCIVLVVVSLLVLSACEEKKQDVGSVTDIVKTIAQNNSLTAGKIYTSESVVLGEYLDQDMFTGLYGSMFDSPDFSLIVEYCLYIEDKNPLLQIEIGIFKVADSKNNAMVKEFLNSRKTTILENAKNYQSVDTEPFDNVIIESVGNYTYYIAVKENRTDIDRAVREKLGA